MKSKFYVLAVLCFLVAATGKSFSQGYLSVFGDSSTTWDVIPKCFIDGAWSKTLSAVGDTVIAANTYKVIHSPYGVDGCLREDTIQGKLWFYDTQKNTEYLVMDLSLNLGDTFTIYDHNNVLNSFNVDSVYYLNNKKHIRLDANISMCGDSEKIIFIEGSGTTVGFVYQGEYMPEGSVNSYMLCHHKDGEKVAGNTMFMDTCYVHYIGLAELNVDAKTVAIFPNPAFDEVTIAFKNSVFSNSTVTIYDAIGAEVFSQSLTKASTAIAVSALQDGVYVFAIGDGTSITYQRLIKQSFSN